MGWLIALCLALLVGGFLLWNAGEKQDLQQCKQNYGQSYVLGHSSTNSSIKWCQSPNGEMKAL